MRASEKTLVLRDLDCLFRRGIAASGDGALLDRFVAEGNERAFEALVARHGPMVHGVCRRLLVNSHDADDAFQATFLVLVRKAWQLRDPDRLGPWLYGVARRVATKARTRSARHRHEPLSDFVSREESSADWVDVMPILDAELGRLPAKHRDVLVLCLLDGASPEEAASSLGCPVGTVKSRLARAREALRDRLTSRGIAPAVVLAFLSSSDAFASPVSPILARATLDLLGSHSVAPAITTLTRGAHMSMLSKPIVMSSLILGGVAVAGLGAAMWLNPTHAQEPRPAAERPSQPSGGNALEDQVINMKRILLAIHNYVSTYGQLPPVANYGADGLPKLSWRVALLPFLEGIESNDLYKEFRQDEPWDSPHNKALIDRMPAVFQTLNSPAPRGQTRIRGFAGKGACFEGVRGIKIEEITDGTSNTALVAFARDAVPWTQPAELPIVEGQPLPALDQSNPQGYTLGMADGSVRFLPIDEQRLLNQVITRAGGEVVEWPRTVGSLQIDPRATRREVLAPTATPAFIPNPTPAPGQAPTPAPAGSMMASMMGAPGRSPLQAIEQRLQRVEEKLDRVLQKLDRVPAGKQLSDR
jgi:RNA polymerase sigma factor (sigma-70 family)